MLLGLALLAPAFAAGPRFVVDATVSADLRTIRGTLTYDACACAFVDPLASLPQPTGDRDLLRTFPGRPDLGALSFTLIGDGQLRFQARLPERFGDVGHLDGWGLYANGGWYPQPVDGAGRPVAGVWTGHVRVEGPADGRVTVLNGVVGGVEVTGDRDADRLALAVLERGVVTTQQLGGRTVTYVEHRHAEAFVHREVTTLLTLAPFADAGLEGPVTIVEDLDLRRLAVPAPGMVYLTDRAFRITRLLAGYHLGAVREALAAAVQPRGDGWERAFVAAAVTDGLPLPSLQKLLGWLSWNPVVDSLLHDGTLPYYSDIFLEAFPDPPVLLEGLGARVPARAAERQVAALLGVDAVHALAASALAAPGTSLDPLARAAGLPAVLVDGWARPYPKDQDYAVHAAEGAVSVERRAAPDAPAEVVALTVDGAPVAPWLVGPGPGSTPVVAPDGSAPRRVAVDPGSLVRETDRVDNRWPSRWTTILSGGIYDLSPSQRAFALDGLAAFRRLDDTRNLYLVGASHDVQDLASAYVEYVRYLGPLLDRQFRSQRFYASFGPSLLDPAYRPTESGAVALGGGMGFTEDTRQGDEALRGHRLSVGVGGGFVPGSADVWASASASGVGLVPLTPRVVLAGKLGVAWASGQVEHRLLALGGGSLVRSVSDNEVVGNERAVADLELRLAVFRNASLPLPLVWLSELQLAPGLEAGALWRGDLGAFDLADVDHAVDPAGLYAGLGATLGVHVIADGLGARPVFVGTSFALPLDQVGFAGGGLQYYLDFEQSF